MMKSTSPRSKRFEASAAEISGGGGSGGGGGGEITGKLIGTINMSKCADMGDEDGVFEKGKVKVVVEQGECAQTVSEAVENSQKYEFRVYAKMNMVFSASEEFSQLKITYSNYTGGSKTYFFDYEDIEGATNEHDDDKGEAILTLDEASEEFTVNCWHQTRVASVSFYA